MRVKKNPRSRRKMCARFTALLDTIYRNDAKVARIMGYANSSPLYRVRRQRAFPDVERLEKLIKAPPVPGVSINLNWIVAGDGEPLIRANKGTLTGMSIGDFIDRFRVSQ
jgi:hypothetical protein